jgi:hypothetical protein
MHIICLRMAPCSRILDAKQQYSVTDNTMGPASQDFKIRVEAMGFPSEVVSDS